MYGHLFRLHAAIIDTSPLPKAGIGGDDAAGRIVNALFAVLAGIALIGVVYGGFKYIISRGESDKIGKAKDTIMYSVIGLGISLAAFAIVNVLLKVLR